MGRELTERERQRLDGMEQSIAGTQDNLEKLFNKRAALWAKLLGDGVMVTSIAQQCGKSRRAVKEAIERRVDE